MTTQAKIGLIISTFCTFLLFANGADRIIRGVDLWVWQDFYFIVSIVFFGLSIFLENNWMKTGQVLMFVIGGCMTFLFGSSTPALLIMNLTFCLMFTYGFFNTHPTVKMFLAGVFFYLIFWIIDKATDTAEAFASTNWIVFMVVWVILLWGMHEDLVRKARERDEQIRKELEQKNEALEQRATQAEQDGVTLLHKVQRLEKDDHR